MSLECMPAGRGPAPHDDTRDITSLSSVRDDGSCRPQPSRRIIDRRDRGGQLRQREDPV